MMQGSVVLSTMWYVRNYDEVPEIKTIPWDLKSSCFCNQKMSCQSAQAFWKVEWGFHQPCSTLATKQHMIPAQPNPMLLLSLQHSANRIPGHEGAGVQAWYIMYTWLPFQHCILPTEWHFQQIWHFQNAQNGIEWWQADRQQATGQHMSC